MRARAPRTAPDEGSSLLIALVLVTVLALGLAALLTFSDSSIRTTVQLRAQAAGSYAADGATQAAVNALRTSTYNAGSGETCFGGSDQLDLPNFAPGHSASVVCSAVPGTGAGGSLVPIGAANKPGSAILTLGNVAGEDGLAVKPLSSSYPLKVHGRIFSNSTINVTNGPLVDDQQILARGACTTTAGGSITSTPPPVCNYTGATTAGDDPNYPAPATVPPYRALPACAAPNSVVTFEPGYYDDASGLSQMMRSSSPCKGSTWWFKPGLYYFDFHNTDNPVLPSSGGNTWTLDSGYLVAGTPAGGAATPGVAPAIPGSCVSPITSTTANGVQFVFGGDSRFVVGAAKAELCGTYQTTAPPIAVYGLSSGAETRVPATGATTTRLTAPGAATRFNPATVPAATTVDGAYATWVDTTAGSAARTGSFSATGYAPVAPIPAGSVVDVATLRVVHGNTAGVNTDVKTVTVKVAGGAPITVTLPSYNDGLMHTDTVNLLTTSGAAFPNEVHSRGYTGATITYAATVKHSGTERVDAVELDLAYRAPAFRGGSGCVTQTPYTGTGSGPCPLILSTNSPGTQFYVQGTTYAPRAALDIALNNVSGQVFKFGVVSRTLRVNVTGSSSFTEAVIQVPDDSPGYGLTPNVGIYLRTYVCAGSGPCPTTGTEALRAKVRLEDDPGTAITAGRRKVVIETWAGSR